MSDPKYIKLDVGTIINIEGKDFIVKDSYDGKYNAPLVLLECSYNFGGNLKATVTPPDKTNLTTFEQTVQKACKHLCECGLCDLTKKNCFKYENCQGSSN